MDEDRAGRGWNRGSADTEGQRATGAWTTDNRYATGFNRKGDKMGKFDGWLLASDMDGTLLSPDGSISEGNRQAITAFVAQGGRFTVATGRMPASILERIHGLPVNCPMIVLNGAGLYDLAEKQWLDAKTMRMDVLHACVAGCDAGIPGYRDHRLRAGARGGADPCSLAVGDDGRRTRTVCGDRSGTGGGRCVQACADGPAGTH